MWAAVRLYFTFLLWKPPDGSILPWRRMLGAVVLLCFSIPDSTQESGCQQGEATGDKVAGSFYIALDFLELTMHTRLSLKLMENFLLLLGLMACTTPTATRQEKANHKAWNRHHLTVMERLLPAFQNPEGRAESHCPHHEVTSGTAEHHTTDLQITHRTEATIS